MPDALPEYDIVFREIPLLIEIEQWIARERGITWRPEFERRVDEVSVALFGIRRHPKPNAHDFNHEVDFRVASYQREQWYESLGIPADNPQGGYDSVDYLDDLGIDIWDTDGNRLRCAEWFVEQAIAATLEIGSARVTLDGSGSAAGTDAEAWGASLEREARVFRTRKK